MGSGCIFAGLSFDTYTLRRRSPVIVDLGVSFAGSHSFQFRRLFMREVAVSYSR